MPYILLPLQHQEEKFLYLTLHTKKTVMRIDRIITALITILLLCFSGTRACAQIRIVDEQDGKPVAGAYIFSSDNHLL